MNKETVLKMIQNHELMDIDTDVAYDELLNNVKKAMNQKLITIGGFDNSGNNPEAVALGNDISKITKEINSDNKIVEKSAMELANKQWEVMETFINQVQKQSQDQGLQNKSEYFKNENNERATNAINKLYKQVGYKKTIATWTAIVSGIGSIMSFIINYIFDLKKTFKGTEMQETLTFLVVVLVITCVCCIMFAIEVSGEIRLYEDSIEGLRLNSTLRTFRQNLFAGFVENLKKNGEKSFVLHDFIKYFNANYLNNKNNRNLGSRKIRRIIGIPAVTNNIDYIDIVESTCTSIIDEQIAAERIKIERNSKLYEDTYCID